MIKETLLCDDNLVQFARFISEAESAGAFNPDVLEQMAEGMDLSITDVCEIIDKAQESFDGIKSRILG